MLKKTTLLFAVACTLAFFSWAQNPPEQKNPAEDAAKANPAKPTPESLAKVKKLYAMDCAMCHGDKGDGKGEVGADMKNMPDFTNSDPTKRTDGQLFSIIKNGKGEMPPEGPRVKTDETIWNLVNYVRAFAKK